MDETFTIIIKAVVTIAVALCSGFVIPLLKQKLSSDQLNQLHEWVKIGVAAAEQLYNSAQGEEKKQYVLNYLKSKGIEFDVEDVENYIEAEVLKLHDQLYGQQTGVIEDGNSSGFN